jgi:hypothetical protein
MNTQQALLSVKITLIRKCFEMLLYLTYFIYYFFYTLVQPIIFTTTRHPRRVGMHQSMLIKGL